MVTAFEDLHKNSGALIPRLVSVGSASTFTGFCNHHDTTMFRPVEVGAKELSLENCFQLSFRALAYELITKEAAFATAPLLRDNDRGRPYDEQVIIQEILNALMVGQQRGMNDLVRWKRDYDAIYLEQGFNQYNSYGVSFDTILPVVACGAFTPEVDFIRRRAL
jgi:hypothetical protein